MSFYDKLKFTSDGLIPAIVQAVKDVSFDCDGDTLLIQVEQTGAACHEGFQSCFFRSVEQDGESSRETEVRLQSPDEIYGKKS